MSDTSFGSGLEIGATVPGAVGPTSLNGAPLNNPDGSLFQPAPIERAAPEPTRVAPPDPGTKPPTGDNVFGSVLKSILPGPNYRAPDPEASALDQTADTLQQRIKRANEIATNPMLQLFNPEGVALARNFIPKATEDLQKIRTQKASMAAGRAEAENMGLSREDVPDEATHEDRVRVAQAAALKGDLRKFKGLQAADPKAAEAIADQVHEVVAGHLSKAELAFSSLAGMQNQGQYTAKLNQLRSEGTLTDLEALGLKVPASFDVFSANRPREAQALREARMGVEATRVRLEERNTYQPMEEKEAKTYNGRFTTAFGDQVTNGTWSRNAAAGTRGLIINGAADPRDLGKKFVLASPEQRKAISEEATNAVPKAELEKSRAFDRTYELATKDAKGNPLKAGEINTNPNVQQGIAEGLASMLRGGSGGANVGLLNIETGKRGFMQAIFDKILTEKAGTLNTLSEKDVRPYLTKLTQSQQRDVLDVLKAHNDSIIEDRIAPIARRAGALGLDPTAFGYGKEETEGVIGKALEEGRRAQIERMMPNHQAIGGGDGVLQLGAQSPGAGAVQPPAGAGPATTQLPGAAPIATPVQQSQNPQSPGSPSPGGAPPAPSATQSTGAPSPGTGGSNTPTAPQPVAVAGQQVTVPPIQGASPQFVNKLQAIETPNQKNPWTATTGRGPDGKMLSSAGGAFQFIDSTWNANKPAGAPDKAKDATPQQQAEALATLTAKNAATLAGAKLPVNDTTLYMAHNVGAGGAAALLSANPGADAREIVGEAAARNNPTFFKGRPTVATVLERYTSRMGDEAPQTAGVQRSGPPTPGGEEKPGIMTRVSRMLSQGISGGDAGKDAAVRQIGDAAVEHAPAIGSTLGAVAGGVSPLPGGAIIGGGAGGAAGNRLKNFLQGNPQDLKEDVKQAALGGVLGVGSAARPVISAAARVAGVAGIEAGAKAAEGGDAAEAADAALGGAGAAVGGELFGRALGMAAHKTYGLFTKDAQKTVQAAAKDLHEANEILKKEPAKLPGANGTSAPNPAYEAAQASKDKAELTIKEMLPGSKPDEVAYAHKVTSEGVPKQEAQVARPVTLEKDRVGAGYNALGSELDATNRRVPKNANSTKNEEMQTIFGTRENGMPWADKPKLPDGPMAAVENKKVSALHSELAEHAEAAIRAPANSWSEKWTQLVDARSQLLQAERDALSSTSMGRTRTGEDMRTLADTVRKQQEKIAAYVFGKKDGAEFIDRLKVLDVRYRRLMDATGDGTAEGLVKAAALKGEPGREADKKFRAFAHDDPIALAAWTAMRRSKGNVEHDVRDLVAAERLPIIGKAFGAVKLADSIREWARARVAGSPATFADFVRANESSEQAAAILRGLTRTAAQRAAVQGGVSGPDFVGSAQAGDLVPHPILNNPAAAAQAVVNQVKSGVHGSLPGDASNRTNVTPLRPSK